MSTYTEYDSSGYPHKVSESKPLEEPACRCGHSKFEHDCQTYCCMHRIGEAPNAFCQCDEYLPNAPAQPTPTSADTWNFKALMCEFDAILEQESGESLGEDNINLIADFLSRKFEATTPSVETEGKK